MLTTYLFRYTSECTIFSHIFKIFFASGGKEALTPLTKILRTFLIFRPKFMHNYVRALVQLRGKGAWDPILSGNTNYTAKQS